jgi:pyruvate/2-oxoglutarate dehydrogenase complex dihydrolipoamide dehydrogenase (E3) component
MPECQAFEAEVQPVQTADYIVIGSGQGGVPFAADMAKAGKRVVLFERGAIGGTCLNTGCTPSKAFLASAYAAGRARLAEPLGVHARVEVDFLQVMDRVRRIREEFRQGAERRLREAGVNLVLAEAGFVGERTVSGGGIVVQAPVVVINTGASPSHPPVPGLDGTPFLTSDNFFEQAELPARLLIMGAGYVGLELGQGMARLGSSVTLIDVAGRALPAEEPDVGQALQEALEQDGVRFRLGAGAARVEHSGGIFRVTLDDGSRLEGEGLLVAVGRRPNTPALRAEQSGITLDERGYVKTDGRLRTSAPGVHAIGDVAGQPQFTHVSWEDYRRLKGVLAGEARTRDDRVLGYAVYTDPQVGRVGDTLEQAERKGLRARAVTLALENVARAYELGQTNGFFRLVVDQDSDRILGATLVGPEAAELVHVLLAHMEADSTWRVLERSVHIHPTLAEGLPSLARLLV